MFGISFTELSLICIVALLVFGPDKLPEVASKVGKFFGTFRKTSDKFRREFYNSVYVPAKDFEKNVESKLVAVKEDLTAKAKEVVSEPEKSDPPAKIEIKEDKGQ